MFKTISHTPFCIGGASIHFSEGEVIRLTSETSTGSQHVSVIHNNILNTTRWQQGNTMFLPNNRHLLQLTPL